MRRSQPEVRPEWDRLSTPAKRELLKLLFAEIRIGKTVHTLSRWSTARRRLTAATARTKVTWRKPGQPVAVPHQPGPKPGSGGARAQRRRQTSIELLSRHGSAEPVSPGR